MKKLIVMSLFVATVCMAQDIVPTPVVDAEMMDKPLSEWQLNLTSIMLVTMILGRVVAAIKKGGGIRGLVAGIWGGTNTPDK